MKPILLLLAACAGPAMAQASVCAALPEAGQVVGPAAETATPPRVLPDRSLACPPEARLDFSDRLPRCLAATRKAVEGNPRRACYAGLPLGPVEAIAPRERPTRSCPDRRLTHIVRLIGTNVGLADVTLVPVPDAGLTVATLADTSGKAPAPENPVLQDCFGYGCRLVKLTVASEAPDNAVLRLTVPGRDPVDVALPLATRCPDPVAASRP